MPCLPTWYLDSLRTRREAWQANEHSRARTRTRTMSGPLAIEFEARSVACGRFSTYVSKLLLYSILASNRVCWHRRAQELALTKLQYVQATLSIHETD